MIPDCISVLQSWGPVLLRQVSILPDLTFPLRPHVVQLLVGLLELRDMLLSVVQCRLRLGPAKELHVDHSLSISRDLQFSVLLPVGIILVSDGLCVLELSPLVFQVLLKLLLLKELSSTDNQTYMDLTSQHC